MKSFLFRGGRIAFVSAVLLVCMVCTLALSGCGTQNDKIAQGVSVSGVELGGMTKEEATKALSGHENFAKDMVLSFEYEDEKIVVPASEIELKADIKASADAAYAFGRTKSASKSKEDAGNTKENGPKFNMILSYNEDKLLLSLNENLGSRVLDPAPMKVEYGKDCLVVTNARAGRVVDADKLREAIESELSDFKSDKAIPVVLKNYTPDSLSFEEFVEKYVKKAKDAKYSVIDGKHNIEPEVIGVEIDVEEARKIFEENKDSVEPYKIPAVITKPNVTAKELEDKYVNKIISTYSTSFAGSSQGRCANIALAASKINGYVVNPGEKFSYNGVVGPRTEEAGFKIAHVYVGTKVVDGIGGGICQVSSTLYNAVVLADLKTITRVNHSIPVSYVPLGRDATVSYGSIDYVFENNKPYPISIKAVTEGTTLTISIVGTSETDYTVEFVTGYVSSIPYSQTTVEDETLAEGETKIISSGSYGSVYESYRVYKRNGVEFDRKFESKSRYLPVTEEVAVGTAPKEPDPEETTGDTDSESQNTEWISPRPQIPADTVIPDPVTPETPDSVPHAPIVEENPGQAPDIAPVPEMPDVFTDLQTPVSEPVPEVQEEPVAENPAQ